jgi:hypothetical protein
VPWRWLSHPLLFSLKMVNGDRQSCLRPNYFFDRPSPPWISTGLLIWEGEPLLNQLRTSNGIRFSITDLSMPTTRTMPSVFAERAAISLYDAQHPKESNEKVPIPENTIKDVLECMVRFKDICKEYGVPDENVQIVATEATR